MHVANLFFETMKPWELKKSEKLHEELNTVLHLTMETLRVCGIILQPVIPELTNMLLNKLNIPVEQRYWNNIQPFSWDDFTNLQVKDLSDEKAILFRRIVTEKNKKIKN